MTVEEHLAEIAKTPGTTRGALIDELQRLCYRASASGENYLAASLGFLAAITLKHGERCAAQVLQPLSESLCRLEEEEAS
jgi:hypothetical protein